MMTRFSSNLLQCGILSQALIVFVCICEMVRARMSVCWAAQSEPRVEVVFLPPVVSVCARLGQPGAIGGGLGSGWRQDEEGERDGGIRSVGVLWGKGAGLG